MQGSSRLIIEAVVGVTDIVEAMHRNIAGLAPIVGRSRQGGTRGITGLVYRSVRGIARTVGGALDIGLGQLASRLALPRATRRGDAVLAALNGVLGDHLAATGNPLATAMTLRTGGRALPLQADGLARAIERPSSRLIILVHGLCMNDRQWQRNGHDHGAALAGAHRANALYLRYNSGLHIASNGREFAGQLERLVRFWPVPVRELVIIGHSMGGLVARSACHCAEQEGQVWLRHLRHLIFLGTPHLGAPLERAGHWLQRLLEVSPYTAPLARLGSIRSAGIMDLRHGVLVEGTVGAAGGKRERGAAATHLPLPGRVRCHAIAASTQARPGANLARLRGDGLVPVASALGQHADPARSLALPAGQRHICFGVDHLGLLDSREACERMRQWLAGD